MKSHLVVLILAFVIAISTVESAKTIKSLHDRRRVGAKKERQLGLFGGDDDADEEDEASEHSRMRTIFNMMQKSSAIQNILKNVRMFSSALDDLAEAINVQIVSLAGVANSNLSKNLYLGKI